MPTDPDDRRLRDALGATRGVFFGIGGFSFIINALLLTVPVYMLQIYDRVLTSRSADTLLMLTVVAIGLLLTVGLLEFTRSRLLVRVGARIDGKLNADLFSALISRKLGGGRGGSQPLRDLETLRAFLSGPALLAFFDAPWTPLFVGVIFLMHPLLGAIGLASVIVLFALALLNEVLSRGSFQESTGQSIEANTFAESSLRNAEAIRAMGMQGAVRDRWLDRHLSAVALQGRALDRVGKITAIAKFTRLSVQIAMLGTGAYLAIQQIITPGILIAASIILSRALAPVEAAINGWRAFVAARSARARLQELLAAHPAQGPAMELPKPQGKVSIEGLAAAPPGAIRPFLAGVGFELEPGEALGVIGPGGAGKSMLARLLVGVWRPMAGHVRLDGAEVSDWDPEELGSHIGYLPQDVELLDGTIHDNIARFGPSEPEATVAAAKQAGVHEMILALPDGYDTVIGEGAKVLSGGQRQRVALARSLYGEPVLVVLDEPNSNLDREGEEALRDAIRELKSRRKTVVIISHRPAALASVDRILVLRDGRVAGLGARDEILAAVIRAVPAGTRAPGQTSGTASSIKPTDPG